MGHANNTPQSALSEIPAETMTQIVESMNHLRKLPKVQTDQELMQRIDYYFSYCIESQCRPGVESLALACGISRIELWRWKNGQNCSKARSEIVQKALQILSASWEQMLERGQINPVSGIFLAKNWFGYADSYNFTNDQQEHDTGVQSSPEEIMEKYRDAVRPPMPDLEDAPEFD